MAVNLKESKNNFQKKNKESFYQANYQLTWVTAGNHGNTNIPRNHNNSNNYEPSITKNNNLIYNCNNGGLYNQEKAAYCMMSPCNNERKKKKINLMDY